VRNDALKLVNGRAIWGMLPVISLGLFGAHFSNDQSKHGKTDEGIRLARDA